MQRLLYAVGQISTETDNMSLGLDIEVDVVCSFVEFIEKLKNDDIGYEHAILCYKSFYETNGLTVEESLRVLSEFIDDKNISMLFVDDEENFYDVYSNILKPTGKTARQSTKNITYRVLTSILKKYYYKVCEGSTKRDDVEIIPPQKPNVKLTQEVKQKINIQDKEPVKKKDKELKVPNILTNLFSKKKQEDKEKNKERKFTKQLTPADIKVEIKEELNSITEDNRVDVADDRNFVADEIVKKVKDKKSKTYEVGKKLIVFTSFGEKTGASTIAINLSRIFARGGSNVCYSELKIKSNTSNILVENDQQVQYDTDALNGFIECNCDTNKLSNFVSVSDIEDKFHILRRDFLDEDNKLDKSNINQVVKSLKLSFDVNIIDIDLELLLYSPSIFAVADQIYIVTECSYMNSVTDGLKLFSVEMNEDFILSKDIIYNSKLIMNKCEKEYTFENYFNDISELSEELSEISTMEILSSIPRLKSNSVRLLDLERYVEDIREDVLVIYD